MEGLDQVVYSEQINQEIQQTPEEYLPALLKMVRLFRETVTLKPAADSFQQGWQEAIDDETLPLSDLWVDIDG